MINKTQKTRDKKPNKILQTVGILYAKNAQYMVRDRLELEEKREKKKEKVSIKRYELALQKCYKHIKKLRLTEIDKNLRSPTCWRVIMKKSLRYTLFI